MFKKQMIKITLFKSSAIFSWTYERVSLSYNPGWLFYSCDNILWDVHLWYNFYKSLKWKSQQNNTITDRP